MPNITFGRLLSARTPNVVVAVGGTMRAQKPIGQTARALALVFSFSLGLPSVVGKEKTVRRGASAV